MKAVFILFCFTLIVYVNCNQIKFKVEDDVVVDSQICPGDKKLQEILPIIMNELSELRKEVAHLKAKMSITEKEAELKMKRRELLLEVNKANHNESYLPNNSRRIPIYTSCLDLELSQTSFSNGGFYMVADPIKNKVKLVYCDFTIPDPLDTEYQTDIGYIDVKSVPTYFYVQRATDFRGDVVTFDVVRTNIANAMSAGTGIFTATVDGIYFFAFSGMKVDESEPTTVHILLNQFRIGSADCNHISSPNSVSCSLQSTLDLKKGDTVNLVMEGTILCSNDNSKTTHFTGYLLEQTDLPLL